MQGTFLIYTGPVVLHWHVVELRRVLGAVDAILDAIDPL
jgi:hypothetical protein